MQRSDALSCFIDAAKDAVFADRPTGAALDAATRIFGALAEPGTPGSSAPRQTPTQASRPDPTSRRRRATNPLGAVKYLSLALENARQGPDAIVILADAFENLAPQLTWTRRAGSEAFPEFHAGHANCSIIGETGLEAHRLAVVGASLLVPGVRYPNHSHPPEELYAVMSEGQWYRSPTGWYRPGPGGVVHHRPNVVHAMRSGASPLLAVWCLFIGR